jgi:hypothetical protein
MNTFNWKIMHVDSATHSMVVKYSREDGTAELELNLPIPPASVDIDEWVQKFLPAHMAQPLDFHAVEVGREGSFTCQPIDPAVASSESANVVGSWNEEYVRALIYTVLEEIRETTV